MVSPDYFAYLRCSKEYKADGINDAEEYQEMKNSMNVCNISTGDQTSIFEILAGILHLGNIDFHEVNNNAVVSDPETLEFPAYLLGIATSTLQEKMLSRVMTTGGMGRRSSQYNVPLNVEQAKNSRDALAKALYSRMFDWIVMAVNGAMERLSVKGENGKLCLGVLDIFGFEIFESNGFEQFCIVCSNFLIVF